MTIRRSATIAMSLMCLAAIPFAHASPPPPVRFPQACAPTFCVEIIPQSPYSPHLFTASSNFDDGTSTLVSELDGGVVVAFYSMYVAGRIFPYAMSIPKWNLHSRIKSAAACLTCEETDDGGLEVIGIAVTAMPPGLETQILKGSDVCYWPLRMDTAGYGTGRNMRLGKKVCIGL